MQAIFEALELDWCNEASSQRISLKPFARSNQAPKTSWRPMLWA